MANVDQHGQDHYVDSSTERGIEPRPSGRAAGRCHARSRRASRGHDRLIAISSKISFLNLPARMVRVPCAGHWVYYNTVLSIVLFKDTGRGRTRTGRTQNADRGRATPHSGTNPHTGQNHGQATPGSDQEQNGRDNTTQKQPRDPTNRRKNHKQPAPRPPGAPTGPTNSAKEAGTHAASATSAPTKHPSLLLPHRR